MDAHSIDDAPEFKTGPPDDPPVVAGTTPTVGARQKPVVPRDLPTINYTVTRIECDTSVDEITLPTSVHGSYRVNTDTIRVDILLAKLEPAPGVVTVVGILKGTKISLILSTIFVTYHLPSTTVP